jgi:hypothetical protein
MTPRSLIHRSFCGREVIPTAEREWCSAFLVKPDTFALFGVADDFQSMSKRIGRLLTRPVPRDDANRRGIGSPVKHEIHPAKVATKAEGESDHRRRVRGPYRRGRSSCLRDASMYALSTGGEATLRQFLDHQMGSGLQFNLRVYLDLRHQFQLCAAAGLHCRNGRAELR